MEHIKIHGLKPPTSYGIHHYFNQTLISEAENSEASLRQISGPTGWKGASQVGGELSHMISYRDI